MVGLAKVRYGEVGFYISVTDGFMKVEDEKAACTGCNRELLSAWPGARCVECFTMQTIAAREAESEGYLVPRDESEQGNVYAVL